MDDDWPELFEILNSDCISNSVGQQGLNCRLVRIRVEIADELLVDRRNGFNPDYGEAIIRINLPLLADIGADMYDLRA